MRGLRGTLVVFSALAAFAPTALAAPGDTTRVSVDSANIEANGASFVSSISANGRYVAFWSAASNLVSGDTNGSFDVFVRDRQTGTTERVSVDSSEIEANSDSLDPSISADGRYVAFWSQASNLVAADANGSQDVFVRDRQLGTTQRVSVNTSGVEGNGTSSLPAISADGRFVAFLSGSTNLVGGDTNAVADTFVHDRQTATTERVSVDSGGAQANGPSAFRPAISGDGRFVAFESAATNLVGGDGNGFVDVFVRDRQAPATERVSVSTAGIESNDNSSQPSISDSGRYVAFASRGSTLVPGDANGTDDVFVRDRQTPATERVSVDTAGVQGNGASVEPAITADGRYVAFRSSASNLVAGDSNGFEDIFVRDRQAPATERVSVDSASGQANLFSIETSISANGALVGFTSLASNLVAGDLNGTFDIFVHEQAVGDTTPPTLNLPANITVDADGPGGSEVDFSVTATDNVDPNPSVSCTPPSGSLFPLGVTNVNCTATDNSGNVANGSFTVTVTVTERSDLEIEKFASHQKASPGQNVTYSFRVTNHGPSDAHNVTVRDPGSAHLDFISGDPGCSVVASEIVCDFGTLTNGATQTKNVVLRLHPSHHSGEAPSQHDLDILKFEQFVSPPAGGGYPEYSLSCPNGYTATDGSARTDSVDQGTGTRPGEHDVENLHFVRSESNSADRRQWDFTLQNHATGQAQAHLFIVCLRDTTSSNDGHSHNLIHHPQLTGTLNIPASGGRHEITLTCPNPNDVAIAPSFEFVHPNPAMPPANPGDPNGPHGPQYKSIQSADGRSWTFGFQTAAAARVEVSIRCLSRETDAAPDGHFEALNFHHVYKRVTAAPFAGFGNSGPWTEARAECPVHYKGITATWRFPKHVKPMGNTPEPIYRDFRIFNKSPLPKYAHIDLLCLKNRTMDDLNGGSVQNNATVYADEPDWNFANNLDFYVLEDPPLDPGGGGSSGGGSSGGGDSGGSSGGGTDSGGDAGESSDPGATLADDDREAKLEACVKRALKIGNKKKRRKAVKECRREFGAA